MNLLVTGGAGFIGSHLVRFLLDRASPVRLVNLDCLTYAGRPENLDGFEHDSRYAFERVDLADRSEVRRVVVDRRITHVMHLAAESHVDRSIAGPDAFVRTNILGTYHLLEACREAWLDGPNRIRPDLDAPPRFLHVSTDEVYGSLGPNRFFTETTPYAPTSPYSASKASSDLLVRAYGHTYGLPAVITNCSNNYGPRQFPEKLIPVVIQSVLERRPVPVYGDGLNVRDWLFVGDHVEALWTVLQRGRDGETYNIGGRNEWPNLRIVERICDLVDELRPDLGGHSRSLVAFVPDRPGHDRRYAIDSTKIETELGWKAAHTFDRGLRETVAWYIEHPDWVRAALQGLSPSVR